ncbi:MAG: hypothetical protein LUP99_02210 [Methanomicrobiales archaeon]|nr:hypothetical protein [Methanomicrobiales archaeon]
MAVDGTQVVVITATARILMAVGTADGATATTPMAMGGELDSMLIRAGGGLFRISTHIPMSTLIIYLHRGSPSSLPCIANRSNSSPTTGITVRIRKVTTRTSKTVRAVGCRWYQMCLRPTSRGGHGRMKWKEGFLVFLVVMALNACATVPRGPSVMVLPGAGKSFEAFQSDDALCRQWAAQQIGISPNDAVNQNLAAGAALGTLAGAGLGAAIGAASGNAGIGAAIGAASGLVGGTAMATGPAYEAGYQLQRRYDNAYLQCMYSNGNQIPGFVRPSRPAVPAPPPPPGFSPGPPVPRQPGAYPPPPPPASE